MKDAEKKTSVVQVKLTPGDYSRLEALASADNRKPGPYARLVLLEHVNKHTKKTARKRAPRRRRAS